MQGQILKRNSSSSINHIQHWWNSLTRLVAFYELSPLYSYFNMPTYLVLEIPPYFGSILYKLSSSHLVILHKVFEWSPYFGSILYQLSPSHLVILHKMLEWSPHFFLLMSDDNCNTTNSFISISHIQHWWNWLTRLVTFYLNYLP